MPTRREFLAAVPVAALAAPPARGTLPISIFSKHLQWLDCSEAARFAKDIGFDGMDLTVRAGGHVLPERVEQDLPKAVEAIRKAGLPVTMITADIVDAQTPYAEAVLRTAAGLGIHHYRWGGFTYAYDRDIASQLDALKPRVHALAELNAKHKMCAMYHTHSGPRQVGAPVWDVWMLVRDEDPRCIGINYDIGHATVEGGYGGWIDSAHLVQKHMRGVALKDFRWAHTEKGWVPEWCPIGEGMVNFTAFFEVLKSAKFAGPVQVHFEYPLGGADGGKRQVNISRNQLAASMRHDLEQIRTLMTQAQLG